MVPRFLAILLLVSSVATAEPPCPLRVASLFAGSAPIEHRLAAWLDADVDAYELRPGETRRGRIRFIARDLARTGPAPDERYDVVLVLNPWILPEYRHLIATGGEAFPYTPPMNPVTGPALTEFLASREVRALDAHRASERLGQIYGAIHVARRYLAPGGRILLLTELLHTVARMNGEEQADTLTPDAAWTDLTTRMVRAGFPDLTLTRNPNGLRERLVHEGDRFGTPWGPSVIEAWELQAR